MFIALLWSILYVSRYLTANIETIELIISHAANINIIPTTSENRWTKLDVLMTFLGENLCGIGPYIKSPIKDDM